MMEYSENNKSEPRGGCMLHTAAALLSGVVSLVLLLMLLMGSGDTKAAVSSESGGLPLMDQYDMAIGNAVSDSMEGVLQMKKSYWLADDVMAAPKPNPDCAGTSQDPGELQWLLDGAAEKLGAKDLIFSADTEILPGSEIRYYLDDTIFSIVWKQQVGRCVYAFNEVKVAHPSQFRRFLSGGEYGSGVLYTATDMANSVNAVSACSGDYYSYRSGGITVFNGHLFYG